MPTLTCALPRPPQIPATLWPGKLNGWVVPEKLPTATGRKRKRAPKDRGYMLVMTDDDEDGSESNYMSYCLERKELKIMLSLAFFGESRVDFGRHCSKNSQYAERS